MVVHGKFCGLECAEHIVIDNIVNMKTKNLFKAPFMNSIKNADIISILNIILECNIKTVDKIMHDKQSTEKNQKLKMQ